MDDDGKLDDQETQENIYRALFNVMDEPGREEIVQGAFLWDMALGDDRQWEDSCFSRLRRHSVRGRPSEDAVRAAYCEWSGRTWNPQAGSCEP